MGEVGHQRLSYLRREVEASLKQEIVGLEDEVGPISDLDRFLVLIRLAVVAAVDAGLSLDSFGDYVQAEVYRLVPVVIITGGPPIES